MISHALLCFTLLTATPESADALSTEHTLELTNAPWPAISYLVYLPEGYDDRNQDWPLLIFLHGAGERGDDLNQVKKWGPPKRIEKGDPLPMIVVAPQCPKEQWWNPGILDQLLDKIESDYRVDDKRIYLTGLSMGGFGTWAWGTARPQKFAALAPICGGGPVDQAAKLKDVPVWAFHGDADKTVTLEKTTNMVDAIQEAGGEKVKLTVYEGVGHNSWSRAYNDPQLWIWLGMQKRD